MNFVRY